MAKMRGPGDGPGGFGNRNQRGNRPNDDMDEENLGGGKGQGDFLTGRNNRFGPRDLFRLMGQYQLLQGLFGAGGEEGSGNEGTIYEDDVNYYGTPGQGQYVGDYTNSPYAQPGLTNQMTPSPGGSIGAEGMSDPFAEFWPEGQAPAGASPDAPLVSPSGGPNQGGTPASVGAPTASPTSFKGAPQDQVAMAMKYGQQYGVDPGVLLAIAKHETGFGELGLGRKGLTLGYGAYDSGPTMKWAGPENQYRGAASTLSKWGVKGINDILGGKAAQYATDPGWEKAVAGAYSALAPQLDAGTAPSAPASAPPSSPAPPLEPEKSEEDDDEDEDED